jgi:hypothetical protein
MCDFFTCAGEPIEIDLILDGAILMVDGAEGTIALAI